MRLENGFTLIELMVVVAIIAIITAVGYPSYQDHLRKARRTEGKSALLRAIQLEERAYTSSFDGRYTTDLGPLFGLAAGAAVRSGENPAEGSYDLVAAPDPATGSDLQQGVLVTATLRSPFTDPDCGNLTLSSAGVRGIVGGSKTAAFCWDR